jgi:hypothetical protein
MISRERSAERIGEYRRGGTLGSQSSWAEVWRLRMPPLPGQSRWTERVVCDGAQCRINDLGNLSNLIGFNIHSGLA